MSAGWPYGGPDQTFGGRPVPAAAPYGGAPRPVAPPPMPPTIVAPTIVPPPRRRTRRRVLVGSTTALALVVAVVAWPKSPATVPTSASKPGPTASASTSPTPASGISDDAVKALFAARSAALTKGDLAGWMATVDPAQKAVVAQQKVLFAGLRALPLVTYSATLAPAGFDHVVPLALQGAGSLTRSPDMKLTYQLRGYDPGPVARSFVPILGEHGGTVLL